MKSVLKRWKDTSADENSGEKDTYFCFPPHSILFFFFFLLPLLKGETPKRSKIVWWRWIHMRTFSILIHKHTCSHLSVVAWQRALAADTVAAGDDTFLIFLFYFWPQGWSTYLSRRTSFPEHSFAARFDLKIRLDMYLSEHREKFTH